MGFRQQASQLKQGLVKRQEEAYKRKDEGSSSFNDFFDKSKVPQGMEFWRCKEGTHEIDIIPFIAGANMPDVNQGDLHYKVDVWTHMKIGAINEAFVCPAKNFKKPCPLCEYIDKHDLSKDEWTAVSAKRRTVFLIWNHDDQEEERKGVQIWDVAHFFFDMHIAEIATAAPQQGGMTLWSDIDEGKSVVFTRKGTKNTTFYGHRFVDRRQQIPDNIADQSFSLDDVIEMHPTYDEISEAFYGGEPTQAQQDGEAPPASQPAAPSQQDEPACPAGAAYGHDFNQYENCDDCPVYDDCKYEHDQLNPPAAPVVEPEPEPPTPTPRRRPSGATPRPLPRKRR